MVSRAKAKRLMNHVSMRQAMGPYKNQRQQQGKLCVRTAMR